MPRLHALELIPDAAGESAVRRDWQALRDAGLPSMLDHTGASNTPHVTVIAVPGITKRHLTALRKAIPAPEPTPAADPAAPAK